MGILLVFCFAVSSGCLFILWRKATSWVVLEEPSSGQLGFVILLYFPFTGK